MDSCIDDCYLLSFDLYPLKSLLSILLFSIALSLFSVSCYSQHLSLYLLLQAHMDPLEDHTCPACRKYFSTIKGVHSHLTSSRKCSWYKKEKHKEVSTWIETNEGYHLENSDLDFNPLQEMNLMDMDDEMDPQDVIEEMEEFFQFIPLPPAQISKIGESGPSSGSSGSNSHRWTSIHLDESEDSQFIETPYPEAGYVTKVMKVFISNGKDNLVIWMLMKRVMSPCRMVKRTSVLLHLLHQN